MRPADLLLFLVGHRGAIERIAASRAALGIGALLVLTAGIARNYDHLDLLRAPEWFLAPFLVSMFSGTIVFASAYWLLALGAVGKVAPQYLTFLSLFWLTAPCAWLYAIPVESSTDLLTATRFNVGFLAISARSGSSSQGVPARPGRPCIVPPGACRGAP
jgi:hypothetical protein